MFYIVYEKFINKVCSICFCFLIVTTCTQMIMTSLYVEFLKRKDIYSTLNVSSSFAVLLMFHYVPLATFDQLFSLTFPGLQMNKKKCHCDCYVIHDFLTIVCSCPNCC